MMIEELLIEINVGKNMKGEQVVSCARAIINEFPSYKLADFQKCFENALNGSYGKLYDRIDRLTIFGWLSEYDKARTEAIINERELLAKKDQHEVHQGLTKILSNIKLPELSLKEQERKFMADLQRKFSNRWINQFFQIEKKQGQNKTGGISVIRRLGQLLSLQQFLDHKIAVYKKWQERKLREDEI